MTDERVIKVLEIMKSQMNYFGATARCEGVKEMQEQAVDCALKALSEIQNYRAIGTVEELQNLADDLKVKKSYIKQILWERDIAIQQLEEIGISLGEKMDFVKMAVEKQRAKKPNIGNDNGRQRKCCSACGCFYSPASKYCPKCGQSILQ